MPMNRMPRKCPQCGKAEGVRTVVYGEPAYTTEDEGRRWHEKYVSGGCCCWGDERDEKWACVACDHRWGGTPLSRGPE